MNSSSVPSTTTAPPESESQGVDRTLSSTPSKQQKYDMHARMISKATAVRRFLANVDFKYTKMFQVLCGIYILVVTFTYSGALGVFGGARDATTGFIIDPNSPENTKNGIIEFTSGFGDESRTFVRAIVADNTAQMVLLGISRFSGFFMYPAIVLVFGSKFRAIQAFIARTPFFVFCTPDTHHLHVYCGWVILIDSCVHTICHLSRWANQGNLYLVFGSRSGLTGFIVIVSTFIIVIPMTLLKNKIQFEMRKYAHYLFWIFAIAMCFHAPFHAFPNAGFCAFIFPTLMIVYFLDAFYTKAFMTEHIGTVKYETNKSGTQITMAVSGRFASTVHSGGYGYIMFEWINKHQWHAFSIYEDPLDKTNRCMFIAKNGDWTSKVHEKLHDRNTVRPVWIQGPFPSPYNAAVQYDNMILVAAGIGITPALSALEAYRDSRRVNLVWAVRDAAMLVFFLKNAKLDHKGFNLVFYTGKDHLPETIENFNSNANLQIVRERPNLGNLLPNIIRYIDQHGKSQHEEELPDKDQLALTLIKKQAGQIKNERMSKNERVSRISMFAGNLGYDLEDLLETRASTVGSEMEKVLEDSESKSFSSDDNINLEDMATDIEAKLDRILADVGEPKDVFNGHDAKCDCDDDHISFPHHRHSIWKTTTTLHKCNHTKNKDVTFPSLDNDLELAGVVAQKENIWEANSAARPYVHAMPESHLERWGMLYCGGRNRLLDSLVEESKDLNIPLHQEAFDW